MEYNNAEEVQKTTEPYKLPFNNLFLNSGVVDGQNKFWMYLAGLSSIIIGYTIIGSIVGILLGKRAKEIGINSEDILKDPSIILDPDRMRLDKNLILLAEFSLFVGCFLMFVFALKFFHKKHLLSVITAFEKFRLKNFFIGFGIWAVVVLITVLLAFFTSSSNDLVLQFEPLNFIKLFFVCIIFMPIQTLCEEVVFRGYLLQGFSQVFKNGIVPLLLTSLMFGLAHMSNPEVNAYGVGIMLTYYSMFALFLGAVTLLSEGLELAYGVHLANNLVTVLAVTSQTSVLKTDAVFYAKTENPSIELLVGFCSIIVVFVVFCFKFKWKNFSLIIK